MPYTPDQFVNNAVSTIAGGAGGNGTALNPADTSLLLQSGTGAALPSTFPYMYQIGSLATAYELVKVTGKSGDTLTIVRGQEGTAAATWAYGTPTQQVATAGNLANLWTAINQGRNYYIRDYGAKCDGTTDDTAAWQAAINAAQSAGGGVVFHGGGNSIISNTLTNTADNVHFMGVGRWSQITTAAGFPASVPMIWVEGPGGAGNFRHGAGLRDLLLVNTAGPTSALGIQLDSTYYAVIERVDIEGIFGTDIYLNGISGAFGAYTHIRDCHIGAVNGGGGSAGVGILTNNHEFNVIEDCVINWFNSSGGIGVKSNNSANIIRGNTFDACDTGIYLNFTNDNIIENNQIDRTYSYAIHNVGAKRTKVIGNSFLDYSGGGTNSAMIYVENTGADNLYQGNTAQTGKPWKYAVQENGGPTDASLYIGNNFAGYPIQRANGIFRSNLGYNPLTPLPTPAAPTVSNSGTGGTVPAGVYQVQVTFVNAFGETVASASGSTTTTGTTSTITITAPDGKQPVGNAVGWYAYVTQAGGSTYYRQQAAGSPTLLGNNLTLTANPTTTGANPPGANTTAGFTQPSVPATTVAQRNTFGVDCTVFVSGGTVSAIAINGVTTGLTSGAFRVPAGQSITLTYTVAPSWQWLGD